MVTVKFGLWSGLSQKFASCSCSQTAYFANCADWQIPSYIFTKFCLLPVHGSAT